MSTFKNGDRVAVYGVHGRCLATVKDAGCGHEGLFLVQLDGDKLVKSVHPKQCRKLKPKAKPREFWLNVYAYGGITIHHTEHAAKVNRSSRADFRETIVVREVKSKI